MYQHTQEIRDLINNTRKKYALLENRKFWNQMCSSLDVIEDTDLAIDSYLNNDFPKGEGSKYLQVYGVLQALFIQQDAVMHLCESLSMSFKIENHHDLLDIRKIRNESIGHPTKKGREKGLKTFHFISRPTISKAGFQLMTCCEEGKIEFKNILINEIIKKQRKILSDTLQSLIEKLRSEEQSHKKRFRMDKLAEIFSQAHYFVEKIHDGTKGGDKIPIGKFGIQMIKNEILGKFASKLKERGIEIKTYGSIKYIYDLLGYPIDNLNTYFNQLENKKKANIDARAAYIFWFFVSEHIKELEQIAKDIDAEYAS